MFTQQKKTSAVRFASRSILLLIFFGATALQIPESSTYNNVHNMLHAIEHVNTLRFKMRATERQDGKLEVKLSEGKVCYDPFKVYIKMLSPGPQREVLWIKGQNDNNALVNPASFPYFNVNLDPLGNMMRANSHHTVMDAGFIRFESIIRDGCDRAKGRFGDYFKSLPDTVWNEHDCRVVQIDNFDWAVSEYTVKEDETVNDIARANSLCEFLIVEMNEDVDDYHDVSEGDVIKVPNGYARWVTIFIDKATNLPLVLIINDENGTFEKYEYIDLDINPEFSEDDFSEDNENYGF